MSQEYFPASGSSSSAKERSSSNPHNDESLPQIPNSWAAPQYMTVGNGSTSAAAEALVAALNQDSGYGGSIAGDSAMIGGDHTDWRAGLLEDRPTPTRTPTLDTPEGDAGRQMLASHVHQLQYNSNRTKLGRSITRTIEILKELQNMNRQWPAHYPSVQPSQRPALSQTQSQSDLGSFDYEESSPSRPPPLKRAVTSLDSEEYGESSAAGERRTSTTEPRLMSHQIAQEFSILKLDLKLGALSQAELVHSLEKASIASLLDGKISQSIKHLLSLRDRIEDTSSKVLVTGDLNAGKSTFCNALLRRKILPEDQQPCTSIFCEVLDARENGGIEEVHAIHKNKIYNRNDESTYDAFALSELENIVTDNLKYTQCKVYVKDVRAIDQSLLNNGVVDIALIDAPGLNSDSVKTTAIFARQEEIDVVVFVVSAANHFTLSAKDFIMSAAHEKAYMFMVVNGFDNIRDKDRCQRMILEQIAKMSPQTHKDAEELVHFVSSNAIPVVPGPSAISSSGSGGSDPSGDHPSDNDNDDDDPKGKDAESKKGKGKEKEKIQDFEKLESALRRFVLERRARSKLAPARTYLLNVLSDLTALASVNRDVAQAELERVSSELEEIVPAFEDGKKKKNEISEQVESTIEKSYDDVYDHTRLTLNNTIDRVAYADLGVDYPGLFSAFQYAEDLKVAMLGQISAAVSDCENYARAKTVKGVSYIQQLGLLHVGEDKFPSLNFRAENMFRKRRHALARQIDTQVELWDFFDIPGLWERQEKVAGTGVAMTAVTVLGGRAMGGFGWIDGFFGAAKVLGSNNLRRMLVPGIVAAALLTTAYILSIIPQTLPPRLSRKLAASLAEVDYVHSNASRIASEVRRVLGMPATSLHAHLAQGIEDLARRREEVTKTKHESEVARKYFANLLRESQEGRRTVELVELEGPLPEALAH